MQARFFGHLKTAAFVLLNYDDKICQMDANGNAIRDASGNCVAFVDQPSPGGRWQVQQALAAVGPEQQNLRFMAIDVEPFDSESIPISLDAYAQRNQYILDAIDEVEKAGLLPIIYTRRKQDHWPDITGSATIFSLMGIPLWDVQADMVPDLGSFTPYGGWTSRIGKQYDLGPTGTGTTCTSFMVDCDRDIFDPSLFSGVALPGANVMVQPVDLNSGATPVSITFASLTAQGTTGLIIGSTGPPPPSGFVSGAPPVYYELSTVASFSGNIGVCINYTGEVFANEQSIRLFHMESGIWTDRTVSLDTTVKTICANVASLSPFAIFEPANVSGNANIIKVTGPFIGGFGLDAQLIPNSILSYQSLAASWSQTGGYSNVSVRADLYSGNGTMVEAFLMTQIGPGTTSDSQIAHTTFLVPSTRQLLTIFSGLTLGPGTYYLVLAPAQLPSTAVWSATNSPTISADAGVSRNGDAAFTDSSIDGSFPPVAYVPAATFGSTDASRQPLLYEVTGGLRGVDTSAPTTTISLSGQQGTSGWYTGAVQATLVATDPDGPSDIASTTYSIDAGPVLSYSTPFTISGDGSHIVQFGSVDRAGNTETPRPFRSFNIDTTPPVITASISGTVGANSWYTSAVSVNWSVNDAQSGIASSKGCGVITLTTDTAGLNLTCTATNGAGLSATISSTIKVDQTPPTVTYSGNLGTYTVDQTIAITCTTADALSGVAMTTCANINGAAYLFTLGNHSYRATATDNAGNVGSGSTSFMIKVTFASLINLVNKFETKPGVAAIMVATLQGAQSTFASGNTKSGDAQLNAFISQVTAQSGKSLTAAQAAMLIQYANALMM